MYINYLSYQGGVKMEEFENGNGSEIIGGVTTTGEVKYGANATNIVEEPVANVGYAAGAATAASSLPTELGFWSKVKAFFLQDIVVELTPRQKKIEKEINDFLFQEITFGKKKSK